MWLNLFSSDRWRNLAEAEDSGVTQTQRSNGGFVAKWGLVVAVPANAVVAISI